MSSLTVGLFPRLFRSLFLVLLQLAIACNEMRLPTSPTPDTKPPVQEAPFLWTGTWVFEGATPAGDCMADALNREPGTGYAPLNVRVTRSGKRIQLSFYYGYEDDVGYLPGEFEATVDDAGAVRGSPLPYEFHDFQNWYCYERWSVSNGTLVAQFMNDGSSLAGSIEETFAGDGGMSFTIRSRFTAKGQ